MRVPFLCFLFSLLPGLTIGSLQDRSFNELCLKKDGDLIKNTNDNLYEPEKCVVVIKFHTSNKEDAEYHCKRWGVFALDSAEPTNEGYAKCVYANVYSCRQDYTQIRGMCYKRIWSLMTYAQAKDECKSDHNRAEVLRYYDELGELLDDNIDDLSAYHIQPESGLDKAPRFFGGSGPSFVLLFSQYVHYRAGYNTINRFAVDFKAYTICQYRPVETLYSFGVMIKKLGKGYFPSMVNGATLIWRTTNHYARTLYGYYSENSRAKEFICRDSMAAILGTEEGTFADPTKQLTSVLTQEIKDSFVIGYASIEFRYEYQDQYSVHVHHYFRTKENMDNFDLQIELDNSNYNGDFKSTYSLDLIKYHQSHQYLYIPQAKSGYNFVTRYFANMAPALCTIGHNHITHVCNELFELKLNGRDMCVETIESKMTYADAVNTCKRRTPPAEIIQWSSELDFNSVLNYRKFTDGRVDTWVNCDRKSGCASGSQAIGALSVNDLDTNPNPSSYKNVICMRKPVK